jgi:hypothetical protein
MNLCGKPLGLTYLAICQHLDLCSGRFQKYRNVRELQRSVCSRPN